MPRRVRDLTGMVLVIGALGLLYSGTFSLARAELLSAMLQVLAGLGALNAGMELLGPSVGE